MPGAGRTKRSADFGAGGGGGERKAPVSASGASGGSAAAGAAGSASSAPATDFSRFPFGANEKVLCFHGPLLYEANVLDAQVVSDEQTGERVSVYYVHYKGWSKKWDEWAPESRVLKHSEGNLQRQQQLKDSVKAAKAPAASSAGGSRGEQAARNTEGGAGGAPAALSGAAAAAERNRKRVRETVDKEEEYLRKQEVKMPIPDNLKVQLVDDWQFVTKNKCLVTLPRTVTVADILREWLAQRVAQKKPGEDMRFEDEARETHDGVRMYFNAALGNALLYRLEREQYRDALKEHASRELAEVYGAEHLLRLFVSLPALIAHTSMDQRAMDTLRAHINDMLKFLVKNAKRFFQTRYEPASPEYLMGIRD